MIYPDLHITNAIIPGKLNCYSYRYYSIDYIPSSITKYKTNLNI